MTWASRRRLIISGLLIAVLAFLLGLFYFTTIRTAPSCLDQKQNQDEEGVDCGGSCLYVCTESQAQPSVRFVRTVSPIEGRTDVIAYVDNPNPGVAANDLPITIELYSPTNTVVAKKTGTVDLPPAATVPVFIPNFFSGYETVARAFITFDTPYHLWYRYRDSRVIPEVKDVRVEEGREPRVFARVMNPSPTALKEVPFVVTIFDREGNAIAASRTIAPSIPARGTTDIVFTWPSTFQGLVSRVEVLPVVPL